MTITLETPIKEIGKCRRIILENNTTRFNEIFDRRSGIFTSTKRDGIFNEFSLSNIIFDHYIRAENNGHDVRVIGIKDYKKECK